MNYSCTTAARSAAHNPQVMHCTTFQTFSRQKTAALKASIVWDVTSKVFKARRVILNASRGYAGRPFFCASLALPQVSKLHKAEQGFVIIWTYLHCFIWSDQRQTLAAADYPCSAPADLAEPQASLTLAERSSSAAASSRRRSSAVLCASSLIQASKRAWAQLTSH